MATNDSSSAGEIKTEQTALSRLASRCSMAEYCIYDVRRTMTRWQLSDDAQQRIIDRLISERYIDEQRFAHAFVRDKFNYNHWGTERIRRELQTRHIADDTIDDALAEIDEQQSIEQLGALIQRKRKTTKGRSQYEINGKLVRFALSRGFTYSQIRRVIDTECDDFDDD